MQPTTESPAVSELDGVVVAEIELVLDIDDQALATREAELIFAQIKGVFYGRNLALAILYDLEIEIGQVEHGSTKLKKCKVTFKLKPLWRKLKKQAVPIFMVAHKALTLGVEVGDATVLVYEAYEHVVHQENEKHPGRIKSSKCEPPEQGQR
jgi:hypothetical protein